MPNVGTMILQTANSPGTGTFSLISVAGRRTFIQGMVGGQAGVYYCATDGTSIEYGHGTLTAGSPDTLTRDTVIGNSAGTIVKISFASTVTITNAVPAERSIHASPDNGSVALGARVVTGAGAAFAVDHLPRFDQVSDIRLGTYTPSGGTITIPTGGLTDPISLELIGVSPGVAAALFLRYSINGGTVWQQGASEYGWENFQVSGTATAAATGALNYIPLIQSVNTVFGVYGKITLYASARVWDGNVIGYNGTNRLRELPSGNWVTTGTPTHWQIGAVSQSITAGLVKAVRNQF